MFNFRLNLSWNRYFVFFIMTIGLSGIATIAYRSVITRSHVLTRVDESIRKMHTSRIDSAQKHTASAIFLHGLGDVGESWREVFNMFKIPRALPHIKFIFPTAPIKRVTLNNGMAMTSWFDIIGLDHDSNEDKKGILEATQTVHQLVESEIKSGIRPERVIVGGFSMGGAVALHAAFTSPHRLGGVVALSTWLPLASTFPKALVSGDKKLDLPILQCHGDADPLVRLEWGRSSEKLIRSLGFNNYTFKVYEDMGHSSCEQEINDIIAFFQRHMSNTPSKL